MATNNIINVPATGFTGTGNVVLSTSPSLTTPSLGVASATSVNFGQSTLSNYTTWTSYTPTVTLVGGAGNTVPVYSTNTGRWMRFGNIVFFMVELFGDGGAEGAGTGQINIALPVQAGASAGSGVEAPIGYMLNNTLESIVYSAVVNNATTVPLYYFSSIGATAQVTGASQNNTTRQISLRYFYEV